MKRPTAMYKRHRRLPEIVQLAVWLYHRFTLSHRDIEDLRAERGITLWRDGQYLLRLNSQLANTINSCVFSHEFF
jgi:hypothetical protein